MISTIRKGLNKKSLRVIVWVLLLALFGLPSVLSIFKRFSQPSLSSIATVNGHEIDMNTYKQKVAEEERRLQFFKQFGAQAEELLRQLGMQGGAPQLALNALIQDTLIQNSAHDLAIQLSPEYVSNKIQDPSFLLQSLSDLIPPALFSEAGTLDFQVLAQYLQRQGISMAAFEKMVEDAIYKDVVFKLVQGALYVPTPVLKELYAQEYSNKKFLIVPFSRAEALQTVKKEVPSDEQLKKYFAAQNAQARRYWVPEKRHITIWTFNPTSYGITISDKEIKTYFAKNKEAYKGQDLAKATPAIKEILQKEKFRRLFNLDAPRIIAGSAHDASLFSTFIANKNGQKSQKTVENDQSPVARKAFVVAAGKKGFVLEDVQGFIVAVDKIEPAYLPDFESLKAAVLRDYYNKEAQELLEKRLIEVQQKEATPAKSETTGWINPQKLETAETLKKQGLPVTRMMRMTHKGDFLDAFSPENAYLVRLEEIEPVDEAQFEAKKPELVKSLLNRKAQQIAQAFVASLQKNATIVINKSV